VDLILSCVDNYEARMVVNQVQYLQPSVLYSTEYYSTLLYSYALRCTLLHCTALYCTLLHCVVLDGRTVHTLSVSALDPCRRATRWGRLGAVWNARGERRLAPWHQQDMPLVGGNALLCVPVCPCRHATRWGRRGWSRGCQRTQCQATSKCCARERPRASACAPPLGMPEEPCA